MLPLSHKKHAILLSISLSCCLSACMSRAPAPTEHTVVIGSQNASSKPSWQHSQPTQPKMLTTQFPGYICEDAAVFLGKSIGKGECVDLVQSCSQAPLTRFWKPGDYVFGKDIPAGTAIATFRNGKYPNKSGYHAAIYSHQDQHGIYAWDQWRGQAVHLRYIKARQSHKDAGNDASRYRVIRR